jgi:hypothetical protein
VQTKLKDKKAELEKARKSSSVWMWVCISVAIVCAVVCVGAIVCAAAAVVTVGAGAIIYGVAGAALITSTVFACKNSS